MSYCNLKRQSQGPNFNDVGPNFSHEMPNFSQSLKFNIWLFSSQKRFLNSVLNNFKTIYYKI